VRGGVLRASAAMKVLYISYDGIMEPLGQSQVLQYLKRLAKDHSITLVSYEKRDDWSQESLRHALIEEIKAAGIKWYPLRYHKRPTVAATSYDIGVGFLLGGFLVWRENIEIVHARSYVSSVIALGLKALLDVKFVFDMRGFWADEKVDGGQWIKGSLLYRIAKWFERRFLLGADRVVSLTRAAVEEMRRFPYLQGRMPAFEVITTCTDLDLFHPRWEMDRSGTADATTFTLGYVGSVRLWYLFDEVLVCFKLLQDMASSARLLVINRGEHAYIRERLASYGIDEETVELRAVGYADVPREICRMDAGLFFVKPVFSSLAKAPTKLGEFLGCGVPCLGNAELADMASILESERVGVVLRDWDQDQIKEALRRLLSLVRAPETPGRCRKTAERHLSLDHGAYAYARIYEELGRGASVLGRAE